MLSGRQVCQLVWDTFDKLPSKGKPLVRSNGVKEWTVLAGIVAEFIGNGDAGSDNTVQEVMSNCAPGNNNENGRAQCICVATGVKALPDKYLNHCKGKVVHDMHAEILARRALNSFILEECNRIKRGETSEILTSSYELRPNILFHMYVSEAPCGDASMGLVREGEREEDDDEQELEREAWTSAPQFLGQNTRTLRGRAHFDMEGHVRTKPGRGDSHMTLSKSCTDKLCEMQVTSLLLGPVCKVVNPQGFYLAQLVVPERQYRDDDFTRAFRRRLEGGKAGRETESETNEEKKKDRREGGEHQGGTRPEKENQEEKGDSQVASRTNESREESREHHLNKRPKAPAYSRHFFRYGTTSAEFRYRRSRDAKPSAKCIVHTPTQSEVLLNGVKMGSKMLSGKGVSFVSRHSIATRVWKLVGDQDPQRSPVYVNWKSDFERDQVKRSVRNVLGGWVSTGTDDFEVTSN